MPRALSSIRRTNSIGLDFNKIENLHRQLSLIVVIEVFVDQNDDYTSNPTRHNISPSRNENR